MGIAVEEALAVLDCQIADREDRARRYIRKAGKERKRRGVPQTTAERMSEYHCHRLDELKQIRAWIVENFPRAAVDEAKERAAFEAWLSGHPNPPPLTRVGEKQTYSYATTYTAWNAWMKRAAMIPEMGHG